MIDLDAIKPSTMDFTFEGKQYSVPALDAMDADLALDLVEKGTISRSEIVALFRKVLKEHAPEACKHMKLAHVKVLAEKWQDTGNVGESSPSSD